VTPDLQEKIALYVLELLEPLEAQEVERACAADPDAAAELASCREAAGDLLAAPNPVVPDAAVLARLVASTGGGRFERFAARMATLYDVTVDRARELLGLMERPQSWIPAMPGLGIVHFEGGPAALHSDNGFIRLEPGATFPWHSHRGHEVVIVLSGALQDHNGRIQTAGEEWEMDTDSTHALTAVGDEPCIYAATVIGGMVIKPRP
jgi:putative transcriptional regulator